LFKVKEQEQSKRLAVLHRYKVLKFEAYVIAALSWQVFNQLRAVKVRQHLPKVVSLE